MWGEGSEGKETPEAWLWTQSRPCILATHSQAVGEAVPFASALAFLPVYKLGFRLGAYTLSSRACVRVEILLALELHGLSSKL